MVLINEAYRVALNLVCFVDGLNIHLLIGLKMHVSETYPASSRISILLFVHTNLYQYILPYLSLFSPMISAHTSQARVPVSNNVRWFWLYPSKQRLHSA